MGTWLSSRLAAAAVFAALCAPVGAGVILVDSTFVLDGDAFARLRSPVGESADFDNGPTAAPAGFTSWADGLVLSAQTNLASGTATAAASADGLSLGAAFLDPNVFLFSGLSQLALSTTSVGEIEINNLAPVGGAMRSTFRATFQVFDSPVAAFLDAAVFLTGDAQSDLLLSGIPEIGGHSLTSTSYQQQALLAPGSYTFEVSALVFPFLFQFPAVDNFQSTSVSSVAGSLRFAAIPEPPTHWLLLIGIAAIGVFTVGLRWPSGARSR